jgi:hypothetical protein
MEGGGLTTYPDVQIKKMAFVLMVMMDEPAYGYRAFSQGLLADYH